MKNKSKESFIKWLKDNGAKKSNGELGHHELDCEDADQIHGVINGSMCIAFFGETITFTAFGKSQFDLTREEFENQLSTLKPTQSTLLEAYDIQDNEELVIRKRNGVLVVEKHSCINLTPDDIYCLSANPIGLGSTYEEDYVLPRTKGNSELFREFTVKEVCQRKTEVSIEEFINICKI